jgi:probable rRNA maturation factor
VNAGLRLGRSLRPPAPAEVRRLLPLVRRALGFGWEVDLALVDDAGMADLNGRFLGLPGPTNVLAFPALEPGSGEEASEEAGQLALNLHAVPREAHLYGQDPDRHLVRLLAHGLLHLAGFDHSGHMDDLVQACVDDLGR